MRSLLRRCSPWALVLVVVATAAPIFVPTVSGPASSVDNEVALFSGTGGKTIKRASSTGVANLTSGVLGVLTDVVRTGTANTWGAFAQSFASATSFLVPASAGYVPTANGSIGYDTTQAAWSAGGAGAINGRLARILYATFPTSDTLTAATISTVETAFATTFTIPANYLIANKVLHVRVLTDTTTSGGAPTNVLKVRFGDVATGTVMASTTATAPTSSITGQQGGYEFYVIGTAAPGASVNVYTRAGLGSQFVPSGRWTLAQPVVVATNAQQVLTISWTYSANTAGNTTSIVGYIVEEVN